MYTRATLNLTLHPSLRNSTQTFRPVSESWHFESNIAMVLLVGGGWGIISSFETHVFIKKRNPQNYLLVVLEQFTLKITLKNYYVQNHRYEKKTTVRLFESIPKQKAKLVADRHHLNESWILNSHSSSSPNFTGMRCFMVTFDLPVVAVYVTPLQSSHRKTIQTVG